MAQLDKSQLPELDPVQTYAQAKASDDAQAKASDAMGEVFGDKQINSICNKCKWAFRFSGYREWGDNKPELTIKCVHPCFGDHPIDVYGVQSCNAYEEGRLEAPPDGMEYMQRALELAAENGQMDLDGVLDASEKETKKAAKIARTEPEEDEDEEPAPGAEQASLFAA